MKENKIVFINCEKCDKLFPIIETKNLFDDIRRDRTKGLCDECRNKFINKITGL